MGLDERDLSPSMSPLYEFTSNHVIPRGTIKLVVTVKEHQRVSTVVTEFLVINCPLTFSGVVGRPLLKALKVVTFIYHLTIKFPTT